MEVRLKQVWSMVLIAVLLVFGMGIGGDVWAEEVLDSATVQPMDQINAESIFDLIKGDNTAVDNITTDLEPFNKESLVFYASVGEDGQIEWRTTSYKSNVKVEWVSSSDPTYLSVDANKKQLTLKKRPAEDMVVTLTLKVSALPLDGSEKTIELPLTIKPGEYIKTAFDYVEAGLFDAMKGENKAPDQVTSALTLPGGKAKNPGYVSVGSDGSLSWKGGSYYPHDVKVQLKETNHPEIVSIGDNDLTWKGQPESDTIVEIPYTLTEKGDASSTKDGVLSITVKGTKQEADILDTIEGMLFDAIKGENTAPDQITSDLVLPANESNPFFAKINDDGTVKWWASAYGAKVKIEFIESTNPSLIAVGGDKLDLVSRPTADTEVILKARLQELGADPANTRDVELKLTVKAADVPESNILDTVEGMLFDAIKGENVAADQITTDLTLPAEANGSNPFFAKENTDGSLRWWGSRYGAKVKVEITQSSNPDIIAVGTDKLKLMGRPTDQDASVDLTIKLEELGAASPNTREVTLNLVVKKEEGKVAKELKGYLDQYLVPENMDYTTIKKEGVDFQKDYATGNVRYGFTLPRVATLAGLPYGAATTKITVDNSADMEINYIYTCQPIRNDVGGEDKTVTIHYTLEKDGESASKDLTVTIPALTSEEIAEEVAQLEKVKAQLSDGFIDKNYDAQNVSKSLFAFSEVHQKEDGGLAWIKNATDKKYYGFKLTTGEGYNLDYHGGEAVFSTTNLVLEKRPAQDTSVTISHNIESILLGAYTTRYPQNTELQKLAKQPVAFDIVVKAIDADAKALKVGDAHIDITEGQKAYSYLLENTQEQAEIGIELNNKSAQLIIAGVDCTNIHHTSVGLEDGYAKVNLIVSDSDDKKSGSEISTTYELVIASKPYLEKEIARLPQDPQKAGESDLVLAGKLWKQYYRLSEAEKASITGHAVLEAYADRVEDPSAESRMKVEQVAAGIFDGIKGQNNDGDAVYTNMAPKYYAKVGQEGVVFTEEAEASDVKIEWKESSAPAFINVFDNNDFGGAYVQAFNISKRPDAGSTDMPVTFKATLHSLTDLSVTKDVDVTFTLRAYNAGLKTLTLNGFDDIVLEPGKTEYTVVNSKELEKVQVSAAPIVPSAKVSVDGNSHTPFENIEVALTEGRGDIQITVNDEIKNTLNKKWDEKVYTIHVLSPEDQVVGLIDALPAVEELTLEHRSQVSAARQAYDALSPESQQKVGNKAKLEAAEQRIAELTEAEALAQAKTAAKDELDHYKNPSDYREAQKAELATAKEAGKKAVDEATTTTGVNDAVTAAKTAMDAIKTDAELTQEEIDNVKDLIDTIPEEVDPANGATIDAVQKAVDAYDNLTEEQKANVPAEEKAKMDAAIDTIVKANQTTEEGFKVTDEEGKRLPLNTKLTVEQAEVTEDEKSELAKGGKTLIAVSDIKVTIVGTEESYQGKVKVVMPCNLEGYDQETLVVAHIKDDGSITYITEVSYDEAGKTITFVTDSFSKFVPLAKALEKPVTPEDKPAIPEDKPGTPENKPGTEVTQKPGSTNTATGVQGNNSVYILVGLLALSAVGAMGIVVYRKKNSAK